MRAFNNAMQLNGCLTPDSHSSIIFNNSYYHRNILSSFPREFIDLSSINFFFFSLLPSQLEKAMAPYSSTLAWKVPWTEEPGRLQSMGSLRVKHDWATSFHFSLSCIGEGNSNPLQCSCLENPRDGGAWWTAVYGIAQSQTRLKRLSSSSNNSIVGLTSLQESFYSSSILESPGKLWRPECVFSFQIHMLKLYLPNVMVFRAESLQGN